MYNMRKTNDPILRKISDQRTDRHIGQIDKQTDEEHFELNFSGKVET